MDTSAGSRTVILTSIGVVALILAVIGPASLAFKRPPVTLGAPNVAPRALARAHEATRCLELVGTSTGGCRVDAVGGL
jgi:hypothetical protein